jgi:hypothetical protein
MKPKSRETKRNPNKIGKRKFRIEELFIEETDDEIENYNDDLETGQDDNEEEQE